MQTGSSHRHTQALTVEIGVDANGEDLTEVGLMMDLGPAEAGESAVSFEQADTIGIEPWFGHSLFERGLGPSTLVRMVGEGPIVDLDQRGVIDTGSERSGLNGLCCDGKTTTHLLEGTDFGETMVGDDQCMPVVGRFAPELDLLDLGANGGGDRVENRSEQGIKHLGLVPTRVG